MMRLILCCLIACSFTGCGLSARQAQNLSDSLAGIEAAQPRVAADPVASAALAGAHDHVEATAEGESLPPPKRTPAAIITDPASYADDASKAVDEARSMVPWWGWLAGAGAAALGVLRFIPGAGGVVADTAWRLLAPQQDKAADAERDSHAAGFRELIGLIAGLRGEHTIAMLRSDIAIKTPPSVRNTIQGLLNLSNLGTLESEKSPIAKLGG
jgi:hypothetical protein